MYLLILCSVAAGLIVLIAILAYLNSGSRPEVEEEPQRQPNEPGARRRALQAARNARARQAPVADDNDDQESSPDFELPEGKVGAKKLAKLQAKAEKRAQRELEEKERQEKKKREELADAERKKQEEKERVEEEKQLEEERKAKEEKEKREHEEYLKMKEAFSVEEEGFEEGEADNENLLLDFVNHIKTNKVVVLEDLAAQFKLKTQSVIDRIKDLQNDHILTGVIDDRGKFIYIAQEELEAVAKFVKQRGRVSIVELAESSNKLIDLNPKICVS